MDRKDRETVYNADKLYDEYNLNNSRESKAFSVYQTDLKSVRIPSKYYNNPHSESNRPRRAVPVNTDFYTDIYHSDEESNKDSDLSKSRISRSMSISYENRDLSTAPEFSAHSRDYQNRILKEKGFDHKNSSKKNPPKFIATPTNVKSSRLDSTLEQSSNSNDSFQKVTPKANNYVPKDINHSNFNSNSQSINVTKNTPRPTKTSNISTISNIRPVDTHSQKKLVLKSSPPRATDTNTVPRYREVVEDYHIDYDYSDPNPPPPRFINEPRINPKITQNKSDQLPPYCQDQEIRVLPSTNKKADLNPLTQQNSFPVTVSSNYQRSDHRNENFDSKTSINTLENDKINNNKVIYKDQSSIANSVFSIKPNRHPTNSGDRKIDPRKGISPSRAHNGHFLVPENGQTKYNYPPKNAQVGAYEQRPRPGNEKPYQKNIPISRLNDATRNHHSPTENQVYRSFDVNNQPLLEDSYVIGTQDSKFVYSDNSNSNRLIPKNVGYQYPEMTHGTARVNDMFQANQYPRYDTPTSESSYISSNGQTYFKAARPVDSKYTLNNDPAIKVESVIEFIPQHLAQNIPDNEYSDLKDFSNLDIPGSPIKNKRKKRSIFCCGLPSLLGLVIWLLILGGAGFCIYHFFGDIKKLFKKT
ncbi:hypothetical protein AYI68_g3911 [Smittium mucronatum]|uniref:Uncharacterized protein n=1 Tax=Smittium mucronatum TaxID=133383 RepID=A0A1R0GYR0_9FUNG|nr:hypothetical protein AYI68_g3911 [Smittium mucronatum]